MDKGREVELIGKVDDIRLYDCDCLFACSYTLDKQLPEL